MSEPTNYPLRWPPGWPVTEPGRRVRHPQFQTTVSASLAKLQKELKLLGASNLILSSNYTLGSTSPKEPGVVAYFIYDKANVAVPCDRWALIEHNILAIAKTIEAMRGMERWGAKHMIKAMFTGFKQLPATTGGDRAWWTVFGFAAQPVKNQDMAEIVGQEFRRLAYMRHPDRGGSDEQMVELNRAYDQARAWLKE